MRTLLSYEFPIAAALVAATMAEERLLLPACIVLLLFWLLRRALAGRWTKRTPVDLPVLLLLLSLAVSTSISVDPAVSVPQALRLLSGIGLFYAAVNWPVLRDQPEWGWALLAATGAALAAFALISVDWSVDKLPFIPREAYERFRLLVADTVHPNVLAGSVILFATVAGAAALWRRNGRWAGPALHAAAGLFMAAVVVLTQSRSAFIALAVAALLLVALRWRWGWLGLALAVAAGVWAFSAFGPVNLADLVFGNRILGGLRGRTEIWGRAILMVEDFSITGVGIGLFPLVVDLLYPFFNPGPEIPLHAHNLFLQVGVDLGVPGLVAWLGIFLGLAFTWMRSYRENKGEDGRDRRAAAAAGIAVQAAVLMHGLFDAVLWGQVKAAPLLWLVWGMLAVLAEGQREENPIAS